MKEKPKTWKEYYDVVMPYIDNPAIKEAYNVDSIEFTEREVKIIESAKNVSFYLLRQFEGMHYFLMAVLEGWRYLPLEVNQGIIEDHHTSLKYLYAYMSKCEDERLREDIENLIRKLQAIYACWRVSYG